MTQLHELAPRWRRLLAWCIDAVLVPSLTIFLVMVAGVVEDAEDFTSNAWMFWVLALAIASYLILNGFTLYRSGQTLGKLALGIAVVSRTKDGATAPTPLWRLIIIRAWFFPFPFLLPIVPLTVLALIDVLPIFTARRLCLHDRLTGTLVIKKR